MREKISIQLKSNHRIKSIKELIYGWAMEVKSIVGVDVVNRKQ